MKIDVGLIYSFGFETTREVKAMGHQVFLGLKLHDVPNTVKQAMKNLAKLDVNVVNLHATGGSAMTKAAIKGLEGGAVNGKRPLCVAVAQLTSTSSEAMNEGLLIPGDVKDIVIPYARPAKENGLDGIMYSVREAKTVREACGSDFLTVTPGIRLADDSKDDQEQVATPAFTKEQGCDYIVVGRSITKSADPVTTYHKIEETMEGK